MKKKLIISLLVAAAIITMLAIPLVAQTAAVHEAAISSDLTQVSQAPGTPVRILIETNTRDYSSVISQISALGGRVTSEFKYAQGLAAEVPVGVISLLRTNANVRKISLDEMRTINAGVDLDQYAQADVPDPT